MKRIFLVVLFAFLGGLPLAAQDPTEEYWYGFNSYNTFQLGSFESVNEDNFNLLLHIPIVSYPQKGTLPAVPIIIGHRAPGWYQKQITLPDGSTYYRWTPVTPPGIIGVYIETNIGAGGGTRRFEYPGLPTYIENYIELPDYSIHNMGSSMVGGTVCSFAIDASGWSACSSGLTDKNGIRYGIPSGTVAADPAGNSIATASSGPPALVDSVGRNIPKAQCQIGNPAFCGAGTWTLNYPGLNGGTYPVSYTFATYNIATTFGDPYTNEYSGTATMLQSVTLPNGKNWTFSYNNFGDLSAISSPTGGSVSYTWANVDVTGGNTYSTFARVLATRAVNANDGSGARVWTYGTVKPGGSNGTAYPGFTDPDGNITAYTTTIRPDGGSLPIPTTKQYYQFTASGQAQTLLKTTYTYYTYGGSPFCGGNAGATDDTGLTNFLPQYTTTTLPNGSGTLVSQVTYTYDSGATFSDPNPARTVLAWCGPGTNSYPLVYGNVLQKQETDYGSGAPGGILRNTVTQYEWQTNSSYLAHGMLTHPASATIQNSSGTQMAQTTYAYDETGNGSVCNMLPCGNLTSETHWLNGGTSPKTQYVYNPQGMHTKKCDPIDTYCTNPTLYTYDSSGLFLSEIQYPNTNTVAHTEFFNYDLNTGQLNWKKDQNNQQTSYGYDSMWRLTSISYPDGGSDRYTYNDTVSFPNSPSFTETRKITSSINFVGTGIIDGLGREIRRMSMNGETTPYDQLDTCYDNEGRVKFMSYPYQGSGTSSPRVCSGAGDSFAYDALNRTTQLTHSDGSSVQTSYMGRATSVSDEGNGTARVQRISQADALGRLTSLCEISGSLTVGISGSQTAAPCGLDISGNGFLTTYSYDALSNLLSVSQGPLNSRAFSYDSLSRLTIATNPESGTTCYGTISGTCQQNGYDGNGNLIYKTDARGVLTSYHYDALSREYQSRNYSDSTPTLYFSYDVAPPWMSDLTNVVGRLVEADNQYAGSNSPQAAGYVNSYDAMGRIVRQWQLTPATSPGGNFLYSTYDLIGDLTSSTNGLGLTLNYSVNRAARLTTLTNSATAFGAAGTPLSVAHYNAAGSLVSATLGNGINETRTYDSRLRLNGISDGSRYTLTIPTSGFAPDSDILLANDSVNGNWTYGYDAFNRLSSASATGQSYTYAYDRYANRWQQNGPHSSQPGFDANNRMVPGLGVTYDAAGNETNDGVTAYTYDAENRIATATNPTTGTSSYVYDASGKRIRKTTVSGGAVDFLYDLAGHEIAQFNSGTWTRGEIYAAGRHLATLSNNTTYYNHADWLGTERARSTSTGGPYETCTSLPFGDWLTCGGNDTSPMHFTGKERDSESGLDNFGARYDSSQYGRFMTPDWSEKPMGVPYAQFSDPQTLNLYAYARNNPIAKADKDGHCPWCVPIAIWVGEYLGFKAGQSYYEGKTEAALLQAIQAESGTLQLAISDPNGRATSQIDLNSLANYLVEDYAQALKMGINVGEDVLSMVSIARSIAGAPKPSFTEKVMGDGLTTGTDAVKSMIKTSMDAASQKSKAETNTPLPGPMNGSGTDTHRTPAPQPPAPPPPDIRDHRDD